MYLKRVGWSRHLFLDLRCINSLHWQRLILPDFRKDDAGKTNAIRPFPPRMRNSGERSYFKGGVMAKYDFKDQVTPEKIIEDLKSKLGSKYNIYSKKVNETASRIFIRKNAAIGCSLRYVINNGAVTCYGPFAYYSIRFALLSAIGVLAIFSAVVTKITGQFNVVIGGLIPVGLAAVLMRLPSRDIVTRVGSIMHTVEGGLKPTADSMATSTITPTKRRQQLPKNWEKSKVTFSCLIEKDTASITRS
jgi:hypothetical protein